MNDKRFTMVVAVDGTDRAEPVLEHALGQAARYAQVDVHLVTVFHGTGDDVAGRLSALAREKLDVFTSIVPPERRLWLHARQGAPVEQIGALALEVQADLVVVGSDSKKAGKWRVGSVAREIVAQAPCPVLVVRVPEYEGHPLAEKQCPACVVARQESQGERWFCAAHQGGGQLTGTVLMGGGAPSLGGGLMP